ncbi:MAG TPA: hypothetical protein VHJ76_07270, partial [Actinomycetota bacterium]|nr:hypothetical protein [Actinomycetota bacterium]
VAAMGLFALTASAGAWTAAALVAAVLLRGLITLGIVPSLLTFVDIPLAWGALVVGLVRSGAADALGRRLLVLLSALIAVVAVSWAFHPAEPLRAVLYLLLLGEPFAIVTALVVDPPTPRLARRLKGLVVFAVAVQVPIGYFQYLAFGTGGGEGNLDHVQGTLYGAGAGHLSMGAIVVVGALWLLSGARLAVLGRALLAIPLFVLVFLADAKQVLFALPAVLLALRLRGRWGGAVLQVAAVVAALAILVNFYPAGRTALAFVTNASENRGGKIAVAGLLYERLKSDPTVAAFGTGPATTVSKASFMTTDLFLRQSSPLRSLNLEPSEFAFEATAKVEATRTGVSSFNSAVSSALGVLGDIGIAGLLVYLAFLVVVVAALKKVGTPMAQAAAAGWAMFAVLGIVFSWWEEPPFAVLLAVMTGLALAERRRHVATP